MLFGMVALLRKFVTLVGSVVVILIRLSLHREPGDQQGAPEFATYVSRCVSKKFGSKVTYGKSEGHFFIIVWLTISSPARAVVDIQLFFAYRWKASSMGFQVQFEILKSANFCSTNFFKT